ncbi:MAG: hypothetical protein CMG71_01235 [Candidatus Marinimicrobia bacterium]|nr:hypothetical protein [Candidatus Neomarinimicrobiota bacterium]|tara:strand:- start:25864 stop:26370 length:507 start_codon:yes stop_codon:yes gene_type:complete
MLIELVLNGLMTFFLSLVIFLIIMRLFRPKKEILYIIISFIVMPTIIFAYIYFSNNNSQEILKLMIITEIHYVMSLAFILTYPVLRIEIPTFKILLLLNNAKSVGLTKLKLNELMQEGELFTDRLIDLTNDGLISYKDDIIDLKIPGRFLALIFIYYRRLLGFPMGRG